MQQTTELFPSSAPLSVTAKAWLALHRSRLTERQLNRLVRAAREPEQIFALNPSELDQLEIPPSARKVLQALAAEGFESTEINRDWQYIQQQGIELVPLSHEHYPELLKQISDPPPLLYVKGDLKLLNQPQLAMVGSRRTSRTGSDNAFRFAREFARCGFTVTSGLALGIDAESHRGALAAKGGTIAVLGTGIDVVYPAGNRELFQQVAAAGAIISEFPLGAEPHRQRFPKRNRVISGMSLGVLVVEAALRSGSLITARCALEQDREVFAIPGSIHNPGSKGCHALIQQGAKLVATAADVMDEMQGWLPPSIPAAAIEATASQQSIEPREQQLLDFLAYDPATIDLLQHRSQWPLSEIVGLLTVLEIKGLVENQGGCYMRIG